MISMTAITTAVKAKTASKAVKPLLIVTLLGVVTGAATIALISNESAQNEATQGGTYGVGSGISPEVLKWSSQIENELKKYGLDEHLNLVLAIVMQESGGTASLDIMQSSESIGLPPNTITDPVFSIEIGIKHFAKVIERQQQLGVDLDTAIQSYNFGGGYMDYVSKNGKKHSGELAVSFSQIQAAKQGWSRYGDTEYVNHVKRYLGVYVDGQNKDITIDAKGDFGVVYNEMLKYKGYPYAFGGSNPQTSFDCSSLMQWAFKKIGVNLPRTAQEQYNISKKITPNNLKPGDLVFFTRTYNAGRPVTHVGMYIGNGKMYDANGGGIGISNLNDNYWKAHLYAYGRVVNFNNK